MKSISFPNMLNTNSTRIISDDNNEATYQNLRLLLKSETTEFQDDPFYGVRLKKFMYEPNNIMIRDLIIDEIYTKISLFMPQIIVKRKDIIITQDKSKIKARITLTNKKDFTINTFDLVLFQNN